MLIKHYKGVDIELSEDHDFSWLDYYDDVFCVFDKQDSGNISFGVKTNGEKRFIKYAGAKNMLFNGDVKKAVINLKKSKQVYYDLKKQSLIKLYDSFETKKGFGLVFEWFDGINLYPHWTFDDYDRYRDPKSSYYQSRHLTFREKCSIFDVMFDFLIHVENKGYTAVDFYDGSLMYNVKKGITKVIDIDYFKESNIRNDIGESFWGSSRTKAPEERIIGSEIDQRTTVYTAGKIIMEVISTHEIPDLNQLNLNKQMRGIINKATQSEKSKRYQSVEEFYKEWSKEVRV
ncbi:hypothetical protein [Shouchella shacheensis]|uniref:hypothetical protein n=1 Tax=Shouchella shacheensis TaxID=1649580 RepID=UPI00074050FB|nr:hypothetical protein [Shouchella shacheensis]